ncbi:MAG: type I-U CRISPR-associated protein Cas7, partial [Chloroflexi bacterium]|nr:type I-U CRISPR-associated protein Cas7 [Chloroflexota bacterium]
MAIVWKTLSDTSRLLMEARLQPVQGTRFQPTGFPDLGAATYDLPTNGAATRMLLVESPQSMANRLETVCWNEAGASLEACLEGMPYVSVNLWDSGQTTNSILEAHRLNSPYIMSDAAFKEALRQRANLPARSKKGSDNGDGQEEGGGVGLVDRRLLAKAAFYYDPCSVLHGVFLEKLDGRARLQRCLSAFVEAANVDIAASGGVKNDRVAASPSALQQVGLKVGAAEGYGNVPFHRGEFTAETITAYFSLDLAQIRAYGIRKRKGDGSATDELAERFLVTLALWKV